MSQFNRETLENFKKSSTAGIADIRASLNQRRAETNTAKSCCAHCGKVETEKKPLRACTRCLAVRYCNEQHQLAHYGTHKHDCKSFKNPPLCRAFNTKTKKPGCAYPEVPIFAKNHKDGMGIFVSINGSIDCTLSVHPDTAPPSSMSPEDALAMLPGADGRYLDLKVLVQNRTTGKDATQMVVVGRNIIAIATPRGTPLIEEGRWPGEGGVMVDHPVPIFGQIKDGEKHPSIQNDLFCAFILRPGNYAILDLQYRCGGPSITRDFQALESIDTVLMPCVRYDPEDPYTGPYEKFVANALEKDTLVQVPAKMDQEAVDAWYKDYKTGGVDKYISTHFGEARAKMVAAGNQQLEEMMKMMMGMIGSQFRS